jgi:hypothetical protein
VRNFTVRLFPCVIRLYIPLGVSFPYCGSVTADKQGLDHFVTLAGGGSVAQESGVWRGFIQNVLVALSVFLLTQLWAKKENNQRIREALFDMRTEIIHNGALVGDAANDLEHLKSFQIRPGYPFLSGLQVQSIQRNLALLAQQNEKYSENLVKYYSDVDALKKVAEEQFAELGYTNQQIQEAQSQPIREVLRRPSELAQLIGS